MWKWLPKRLNLLKFVIKNFTLESCQPFGVPGVENKRFTGMGSSKESSGFAEEDKI